MLRVRGPVAFSSDSPGPKSRPNAYAPGPHLPEVLGETTGPRAEQMQFPFTTSSGEKYVWSGQQAATNVNIKNKISAEYGQSKCGGHYKSYYTPVKSKLGVYSSFALLFCCIYP